MPWTEWTAHEYYLLKENIWTPKFVKIFADRILTKEPVFTQLNVDFEESNYKNLIK